MIVFKTFLKVAKANIMPVIMFTVILVFFSAFSMQTSDTNTTFVASKPDILIINNDENKGITKDLIQYLENNSNIIDVENEEEAIQDALFYRKINYIVYIPSSFREDFLNGDNPNIEIKSTGDYQASLAEMLLERYIKIASMYRSIEEDEVALIQKIHSTLEIHTNVEITSKLETDGLSKATYYYNFANYSILAGCVYVICLILSSFKNEKVKKRTVTSSMNYRKYNRSLLLSNCLFAVLLWVLYVMLSFIFVGHVMVSLHGIIYIINSFIFTICAVTMAFLIANIISDKNAINGIVNVVALGSSFLCGAFVPLEWLPTSVLTLAHILPSYYYISSNELLTHIEVITLDTLKPILCNMGIVILFSIAMIIITNIISKRRRKIG